VGDHILVADVADDQLGVRGKVIRTLAVTVDLLDQAIEHPDAIPTAKKFARYRPADKSRTACN
jgi:hypothetical protein